MSAVIDSAGVVVPELGQVIRCRDRVWAVNAVEPSSLPVVVGTHPRHLVQMASLEEGGFGDDLTVLWEREPGILDHLH